MGKGKVIAIHLLHKIEFGLYRIILEFLEKVYRFIIYRKRLVDIYSEIHGYVVFLECLYGIASVIENVFTSISVRFSVDEKQFRIREYLNVDDSKLLKKSVWLGFYVIHLEIHVHIVTLEKEIKENGLKKYHKPEYCAFVPCGIYFFIV